GRGDLLRLGGAPDGLFGAEFLHLLRGYPLVGGVERRPYRTGGDGIDADALGDELLRQGLGEGVDRSLGRRVVGQLLGALDAGLGAGGDDRAAGLQVLQGGLGQMEVGVDVRAEGLLPLLLAYLLKTFLAVLPG